MSLSKASRAAALIAALGLSACGFQPLYGDRGAMQSEALQTRNVSINVPEGRIGQLLRNEMIYLMGAEASDSTYQLVLTPRAFEAPVFADTLGNVTSYSYRINTQWLLRDLGTDEVLAEGTSLGAATYNRTDQPFANIRAQREAEERASKQVAEDISIRVAAYFATRESTAR